MKKSNLGIIIVLLAIVAFWYFSAPLLYTLFNKNQNGVNGDMFAAINSLFAGLAFGGIIMTIYLQKKELSLQRQELINTREIFQKQKFENTFFQLSSLQQELLNSIHHKFTMIKLIDGMEKEKNEVVIQGRNFFNFVETDFKELYSFINRTIKNGRIKDTDANDSQIDRMLYEYSIDNNFFYNTTNEYQNINLRDDTQLTRFLYGKIFHSIQHKTSHYFRHLYSILKFIDSSKKQELALVTVSVEQTEIVNRFQQYANFLQAQLSPSELFLIFYNALRFPKMKALIEEYAFLENLPVELLISKEHQSWYKMKFKSYTTKAEA